MNDLKFLIGNWNIVMSSKKEFPTAINGETKLCFEMSGEKLKISLGKLKNSIKVYYMNKNELVFIIKKAVFPSRKIIRVLKEGEKLNQNNLVLIYEDRLLKRKSILLLSKKTELSPSDNFNLRKTIKDKVNNGEKYLKYLSSIK